MTDHPFAPDVFSVNRPFAAQKRAAGIGRAGSGWRAAEKSQHDERGGQCDCNENVEQDAERAVMAALEMTPNASSIRLRRISTLEA